MAIQYSNLPIDVQVKKKSSSDDTVTFFDNYNKEELQFKSSASDAAIAFFTKRGMQEVAAKSTAFLLLKQCKLDGVEPFTILDKLKELKDDVQLSDTLGEILNVNRIKVSFLGTRKDPTGDNPAKRNIIA